VVGESNLSDLALCCEYLTLDKTCSGVLESQKAKAARQIHCQNDEKTACCYLCLFKRNCSINCRFLGNVENKTETEPVENQKTDNDHQTVDDTKTEAQQTKETQIICCSTCDIEMTPKKIKFKIDCDVSDKFEDEFLPVIFYLCPKCGKIEFRADKN
jgi:hypothetical protein